MAQSHFIPCPDNLFLPLHFVCSHLGVTIFVELNTHKSGGYISQNALQCKSMVTATKDTHKCKYLSINEEPMYCLSIVVMFLYLIKASLHCVSIKLALAI